MKPAPTKQEQRKELEQLIEEYQARGGTVLEVPRGLSGRDDTRAPLPHVFDKKNESDTRTPVNEVIAAIEERRHPRAKPPRPGQSGRPRKKMIYDEFGEPLRWQWVE